MIKFTESMTSFEKRTACICALIACAAVLYCLIATLSVLHTLCLLAVILLFAAVIFVVCRLNAGKANYRSKTWAVYFILLAGAAAYMYAVYNYDFKASPSNLLFGASKISTYEDALEAAKNDRTNTVAEVYEDDLTATDFSYALQRFNGGVLYDSNDLYKYYIMRFDGRFVLLKADPEYLRTYFDQKKENGDKLTRLYVSVFDRADAGTYDSIYTPTQYLYPYGFAFEGIEKEGEEEAPDFFETYHRIQNKYYSDLPLYELSSEIVMTIKDYDLNEQKTILIGMIVLAVFIVCAVITVLIRPSAKTEADDEMPFKKKNKKERSKRA